MKNYELTTYMNDAIERIVSDVLKNTLHNPKETAFLLRFLKASKEAAKTRLQWEENNTHIPVFLISSITHSCNLHCKGCYARANGICHESSDNKMLSAQQWSSIFAQAQKLGINFHLLAGGEPLLRQDILIEAARFIDTLHLIFTNGTLLDDFYYDLFRNHRNLVPVLSLEGDTLLTDARRGQGTYNQLMEKMEQLYKNKILYGVSITLTKENLDCATKTEFIQQLNSLGCRLVFFIEYVPIDGKTKHLAFEQKQRDELKERQSQLRKEFLSVLFLSFPGDEKEMGGCLAAGRGFFHINPYGEAQACPFAPYSDCNLRDSTLLEVLDSRFFQKLKAGHLMEAEHMGGCALFEQEQRVKELLKEDE